MRAHGRGTRRRRYLSALLVATGVVGVAVEGSSAASSARTVSVTTRSGGVVQVRWVAGDWTTLEPAAVTSTSVPQIGCIDGVNTMFALVNKQRTKAGKKPLVLATKLTKAAQAHNRWMASTGNIVHGDARYPNKWIDEIREQGYGGWSLGQNLAAGNGSASAAFGAWMGSPGHKANILGAYKHVGIACRDQIGTRWRIYWTVNFGNW
jgi:uncharacterized protein YkwD